MSEAQQDNMEQMLNLIMQGRAYTKALMEFTCYFGERLGLDRKKVLEDLHRRAEEHRAAELEQAERIDPALAARLDTRPVPGLDPDDEWSPAS